MLKYRSTETLTHSISTISEIQRRQSSSPRHTLRSR